MRADSDDPGYSPPSRQPTKERYMSFYDTFAHRQSQGYGDISVAVLNPALLWEFLTYDGEMIKSL